MKNVISNLHRSAFRPNTVHQFAVWLALAWCVQITSTFAQAVADRELAGAAFKNVTALSEMPADQMGKVMNIMSASLGVNCQYCHEGFDFAKEKVAHKDVSRKMIEMTFELNDKFFEGRNEVTCYTCHRGAASPTKPVLFDPVAAGPIVPQTVAKSFSKSTATVDEVLAKYVEAIGGQEKLSGLKTRHTLAKRIEPDGRTEAEELWQSADGKHRVDTTYKSVVVSEVFDGKSASKKANGDAIQLKPDEAFNIEREARLAFGLNIKASLDQLSVGQVELIHERRMQVLEGVGPQAIRERLYFDEQSGMLTRRTASVPTVLGDFIYQVDYGDFKTFDGIQLPTTIIFSVPNIRWTREVVSVEHNRP